MSRDMYPDIAQRVSVVGPKMAREFKTLKTEKRTIGYLRCLGFSKYRRPYSALSCLMEERFEYSDKDGVFEIGIERVDFPPDHNFRKLGVDCAYRLIKEIIHPRVNQRPFIEQADPTPIPALAYSP